MTLEARHLSVAIERAPSAVYQFASNPENLPRWASGLSKSRMQRIGDVWTADSPMGQIKVRFVATNPFGVIDHDVTLPSGQVVHNPLRVLQNGSGSEVVFTLYRQPGVTDAELQQDALTIRQDLERLKSLLEV